MLTCADDVVAIVTIQMSTAAQALSAEGLESAVDSAMNELGWAFPISDPFKILWVLNRTKRHACYILWVASAQKFKYKQVNLNQRFDHYEKLIKSMDREYEEAQASSFPSFASVASYKMFGDSVGAGFTYDSIGNDLTYADLQRYINTGE